MKNITFLISILLLSTQSHAQWQQTNGPGGGTVDCLLSDGTVIYAGLDLGGGVYKSVDGGENWNLTALKEKTVYDLLKDGNKLYAATASGIYISTNNAASWILSDAGITPFYNTSFTKSGTNIFVGTNQGIYVTANNGASWTLASTGLPANCSIEKLFTSGTRIFAGTGNGLFVSDNQGVNWVHYANNSTSAEITNQNTVYDFMESQGLLFAGAAHGVYYSENNGDNWTLCDGLPVDQNVYSLTKHNGILYAGSLLQGMFSSSDNGASWTSTNNYYRMVKINSLVVHEDEIFAGTNVKGIFKTANGGLNWEIKNNGINETNVSLLTGNATTIFAGVTGHNVFRSEDEGNTWEPIVYGINPFLHLLEIVGNKIFLGTEGGLYVSEDNGDTWSLITDLGTVVANSMLSHNSKLYLAASDGLYVSEDNGVNWTLMSEGLPNEVISSVVVIGTTLFATSDGDIYKSEDDALTWTLQNGNMPSVVAILTSNGNQLLASTGSGIWFSNNLGQTWNNSTIPWQLGYPSEIEVYGSRYFFGSYMGAFVSADNGQNWVAINEGFPIYPQVGSLHKRGNMLFAGTMAHGVWKRAFSDITVSVEEEILDQSVLYPNPFSGKATLKFYKSIKAEIQICDLSGKVLRTETFAGDVLVIEQKDLQSGTYFLNIQTDTETTSHKFVVR